MNHLKTVIYDEEAGKAEGFDDLLRELAAKGVAAVRADRAGEIVSDSTLFICGSEKTCSIAKKSNTAFVTYMIDTRGSQCVIEGFFEVTSDFCERMLMRKLRRPWIIAMTDRLVIREFKEDDALDVFDDRWGEAGFIREYIDFQYHLFGYGIWALETKQDKKIIGKAGLFNSSSHDGIELGYEIAEPYRQRGYAFEACSAICRYAESELDAHRLYVTTTPDNIASKRLAAKLKNAENVDIIVSLDYTHH